MSSSSPVNYSVTEDRSLHNEECELLQKSNKSELDAVLGLKWKLLQAKKENLDLAIQHNQEVSNYEKQIIKLRSEFERGEAIRQGLEYELAVARKGAHLKMCSAEEELSDAKNKLVELQVLNENLQQKVTETEETFHNAQQKWEEEQQRLAKAKDDISRIYNNEYVFLLKERNEAETILLSLLRCDRLVSIGTGIGQAVENVLVAFFPARQPKPGTVPVFLNDTKFTWQLDSQILTANPPVMMLLLRFYMASVEAVSKTKQGRDAS